MALKTGSARWIAAAGVVALIAISGLNYWHRMTRGHEREIEGTITSIDTANRRATIEFVHPKTGQTIQLAGDVPAECEILIDDKPSQLADLAAGDAVSVLGTVYGTGEVTPKLVRATHHAIEGMSSQPAAPADSPPGP